MPRKSPPISTSRSTPKIAQARNKFQLPRIELSRLTVRQYRNAVTDLIGSFRSSGRWDEERGLKGEYSSRGRRRRDGNGAGGSLNRVDPEIKFHFGTSSPIPEQDALKDVAKSWQQAPLLFVPLRHSGRSRRSSGSTGRDRCSPPRPASTNSSSRQKMPRNCAVNDLRRPLIDALVKSGNDTEYRGSIYLLGGRAYPIRLEFSRSKEKTSSIALEWKAPTAGVRGDSAAQPLASLGPRDVRPDRPRFHPMIAASAMSAAHRFRRPGIRRRPTRRSRSPATSSLI